MKYLYIILLTLTAFGASAQNKIGLAIKLGGGLASQHVQDEDVISSTSTGGFNFGGMALYRFYRQWEMQAGLEVASKGSFITEDAMTTTQHAVYVEVPLSLVHNFKVPGLGLYYVGGGGYFSRGTGGYNVYETPPSETSNAIEFGSRGDLLRYDAGLNFTTGLKLDNKLIFDVSYQVGLANLTTDPLKDTGTYVIKNRFISVSLGYLFR